MDSEKNKRLDRFVSAAALNNQIYCVTTHCTPSASASSYAVTQVSARDCVLQIEPCHIFNMLVYLLDSDTVPPTTISSYTHTTVTEGECTVFSGSVMNAFSLVLKLSFSQQVSWYYNLIALAVWSTHVMLVFCSASDVGLLASITTQAAATMTPGNSCSLFLFFYVTATQTALLDSHSFETVYFP